MEGRLTLVVCGIDLRARIEKRGGDLGLVRGGSDEQRGPAEGVAGLEIGREGEQELDDAEVVSRGGPVEGRAAVLWQCERDAWAAAEARPGTGQLAGPVRRGQAGRGSGTHVVLGMDELGVVCEKAAEEARLAWGVSGRRRRAACAAKNPPPPAACTHLPALRGGL